MLEREPFVGGPRVDDHEELYRVFRSRNTNWWNADERRVSSAAFNYPVFSVDIASRTTPAESLARMADSVGIVGFKCGDSRRLGFDPRDERDPEHPENLAHANVYLDLPNNQRKRAARGLVQLCRVVVLPNFDGEIGSA